MGLLIICLNYMGNSLRERDVFFRRTGKEYQRKREVFVITPLPIDEYVVFNDQLVIRAIAESEERILHVGFPDYDIDGIRYRWIEIPRDGEKKFHQRIERPDDVFSKAPVEVRIAAFTKTPQTIRV